MALGWRRRNATLEVEEPELTPAEIAAAEAAARLEELRTRRGDQYCSARGCSEQSGVACAYIDRRERSCPTAWCAEHRQVTHDQIYCPMHARLLDGTHNDFSDSTHPDLENRAPAVVNWAAREMQEDVDSIVEGIARDLEETLVVDPVRFVLFGVERVRTWDRSWKTVTIHGHSFRAAIAVEEARPDVILGKVNSQVVVRIPAPWHPDHMIGIEPATPEEMDRQIADFRRRMFFALAREAEAWRSKQMAERAAKALETETDLAGSGPGLVLEGRGDTQRLEPPVE